MRYKSTLIAALALVGALVWQSSRAGTEPAAATPNTSSINRYQIAPSSNAGVWLVDSQTGHVWYKTVNQDWWDQGVPANVKE